VGAVIEENVVANFGANPDWTGKCLKSSTWIHRELSRSVGEANSVCEAGGRILVIDAEIVESDFASDENAEGTGSGLELRPKKAMQRTELRIYQLRAHSVAEGAGVVAFEVIRHFGLELYVTVHVDGSPSSQTYEVSNRRGIAESKVVCKCTNLDVIGMILCHHQGCRGKK